MISPSPSLCVSSKVGPNDNGVYASKLVQYQVNRLKIVRLEKRRGEPLGATICRPSTDDGRVFIARIVHRSLAEGLFSLGDQLLEVNDVSLHNNEQTLDDIVQHIDSLHGHISFVLLPHTNNTNVLHLSYDNKGYADDLLSCQHVRCLYSYDPADDLYVPCRELAIGFCRGQILELVNSDDPSWWQVFLLSAHQRTSEQSYPNLVPSQAFQDKRHHLLRTLLLDNGVGVGVGEESQSGKQRKKQRRRRRDEGGEE